MQDEVMLVRKATQGDQEAFGQIYEQYFDKIYRYVAFKIGDKTEAEDMTQQVFLKALRSISSFKWKGKTILAWLYRIAHNQVVDYYRKTKKRNDSYLDESLVSSNSNPQKLAEHKFDVERVVNATRRLTDLQREVIALRFTSELSTAEVAEIMGKKQGAIKALQHSAVVALRKQLVENSNGKI